MKKKFTLLMFLLLGMVCQAQENPNRMLIREKSGNLKGYLVERLDSIYFVNQEGRVAADLTFKEYKTGDNGDTLMLSVQKTEKCQAFRIECLPAARLNAFATDAGIASYFDYHGGQYYYDNFTDAQMTGFEFAFEPNTEYAVFTMGYDQYGIACSSSIARFTTPRNDIVGNPSVEWSVEDVGQDFFTMKFVPNADCAKYAICQFEAGTAEEQFNMWAPMFGFANMGDMIVRFSGSLYTAEYTKTWNQLAPGKDYEVYIQPLDANGSYADMVIASVSTQAMGGTGVAEMTITIGDFGGNATSGYYQYVTYTPNSEVSLHRDIIITKEAFNTPEWGEANVKTYLQTDNPYDPYWDQYGVDVAQWNVEPQTEYIAFSIAKNINGEWGPLAQEEFTTPVASGAKSFVPKMAVRRNNGNAFSGSAPFTFKGKTVKSGSRLMAVPVE